MAGLDFSTNPEEEKDRNFITALARGLDVLRCFRVHEIELTNTEFAERTGLPKPTVSRLTHTLCKLDYLVADPRTGTYRLSAGVLQLGYGVLTGMDIADRASEEMIALRNGPNSYITCALGERHRMDVVYVAVRRSREEVALALRVASRLPLFFSAIGRAILLGMDDDTRAKAFEDACRDDPAGEQARLDSFKRSKSEYESIGYCTGFGEWRADVNGIAVPVFSLNGARIYGLNVGGPSFHVKKKQLIGYYAKHLVAAGERLSIKS